MKDLGFSTSETQYMHLDRYANKLAHYVLSVHTADDQDYTYIKLDVDQADSEETAEKILTEAMKDMKTTEAKTVAQSHGSTLMPGTLNFDILLAQYTELDPTLWDCNEGYSLYPIEKTEGTALSENVIFLRNSRYITRIKYPLHMVINEQRIQYLSQLHRKYHRLFSSESEQ